MLPWQRGWYGPSVAALSGGDPLRSALPQASSLKLLYVADTYDASTKALPNLVNPIARSANLFRASRRMFANTEWWTKTGSGTITDDAAVGPDGLTEASTANLTGAWNIHPAVATYSLPIGTYTLAVYAMRNTGSDQQFSFSVDNTGTRSPANTATSAWQRFTYTFTLVGTDTFNRISICSIDGTTAANIQICDFELYAGSADLGPQTFAGHLYLGANFYDTRPSCAAGVLDMTSASAAYGLIQLPTAATIGAFTTQALLSKTAAGSAYHAWFSRVQNYLHFTATSAISLAPTNTKTVFAFNNWDGSSVNTQAAGLWPLLSKGYHLLTHRYDASGTRAELWLDDIRMFTASGALATFSLRDLFHNLVNSTGLYGGEKYVGMAFWDVALTDAQIRATFPLWQARAALSSVTVNGDTTNRIYAAEGDSITALSTSYSYVFGGNASPVVLGTNWAVSGSTLANLVTRASYVDAVIPTSINSRKFIFSVLIGANDLGSYTGATDAIAAANYLAALASYCDARRAAGWKVVVGTILPISGGTAHNARRAIVNSAITSSWTSVHCDGVADFAADATMGTDTSFTDNPSKWTDGTHPNTAGHAILETIIRPIINAL
jgi:lysophospholipase L1-like esterase